MLSKEGSERMTIVKAAEGRRQALAERLSAVPSDADKLVLLVRVAIVQDWAAEAVEASMAEEAQTMQEAEAVPALLLSLVRFIKTE